MSDPSGGSKAPENAIGAWINQQISKAFLAQVERHTTTGTLMITLPDGNQRQYQGAETGPTADLHFKRWRSFRMLVTNGSIGFSEAFMADELDTSDLKNLLDWFLVNPDLYENAGAGQWWKQAINRLIHVLRPNTKSGSRKNIAYHYDLGNDFYRLWLDDSMTYSSAIYDKHTNSLEQAQHNKYASMVEMGQIRPEHHVLEIGCGWGGFAEFAAKNVGCHVTSITISQEQYDYAAERIQKAGLNEKVTLRMQDYRDVEPNAFDRIASIEMFEAVGERYWPVFFNKVREVLKPDGVAALQIIFVADHLFESYRRSADFIQRYIFPGGMLPSPSALKAEIEKAHLTWHSEKIFGRDYARTLMEWHTKFNATWDQIQPMGFDRRFQRMWQYYLCYCAAGFDDGRIDVRQVVVQKGA